ncbi:serine/arginine-rich splicing factor SR45a-like isoform X3 [Diospyros lotus]|uniref:serine/arginine-rich splicing factor SR45a-like isoform X3 n=1 Tax=Diospyros lotus TaxID=55363 RepID=UPI002256C2A6|nr:serine/arginine-rich splicing factor SR45a-like isoform X3 [Diospyros lotus]
MSHSRRSRSVENPGNNLYVTGLSTRVTKRDLEKHFSTEGKVEDVHIVVDPWTRESRGFGFVTMSTVKEADCCIKYLDGSVLEGRVITVEKARRRRGRTPTPGRYLGLRTDHARRHSPSYPPYYYYRSNFSRSSSERDRSRSYSPSDSTRSYSPYDGHRGSYSHRCRSYSPSRSPHGRSPVSMRDRSYSPYDFQDDYYYRRDRSHSRYSSVEDHYHRRSRRRSVSRTARKTLRYDSRHYSPDDHYYSSGRYRSPSRSISPRARRRSWRSYSESMSPEPRRSQKSHSSSKRLRRSYSRSQSISPGYRRRTSYSCSISPRPRKSSSRHSSRRGCDLRTRRDIGSCFVRSYSRSCSGSSSSPSVSRSATPRSASSLSS